MSSFKPVTIQLCWELNNVWVVVFIQCVNLLPKVYTPKLVRCEFLAPIPSPWLTSINLVCPPQTLSWEIPKPTSTLEGSDGAWQRWCRIRSHLASKPMPVKKDVLPVISGKRRFDLWSSKSRKTGRRPGNKFTANTTSTPCVNSWSSRAGLKA